MRNPLPWLETMRYPLLVITGDKVWAVLRMIMTAKTEAPSPLNAGVARKRPPRFLLNGHKRHA